MLILHKFPNVELPTATDRAWHGAEILPMFGSSEDITKQDSTWQERSMGSYMRGAWAAFAACPTQGLTQYGWMPYSNTTTSLLQLGFDNPSSLTYNVVPSLNGSAAYDGMCGSFPVCYTSFVLGYFMHFYLFYYADRLYLTIPPKHLLTR